MEATGLGGPMLGLVLIPGLLAAGIGSLIFLGLDSLTGLGTFSLAIPGLPAFARPNLAEFGWAVVIGIAAALVGTGLKWLARLVHSHAEKRNMLVATVGALVVAGLAIAYAEGSGKPTSDVLFSGQSALGPLVTHAASYTVGAVVLLVACKCLAYAVSLGSFRGGPVFPSMFIGAAGGIALSHLPGLPEVAGSRDGHRRDVRGDADAAADLGPAGHPAARLRRPRRHAAGHRRGRRGLRCRGQDHTGGDHRIGSPGAACCHRGVRQ